jgi:uncharacterized membrane protein YbhN (UPF0104 family)
MKPARAQIRLLSLLLKVAIVSAALVYLMLHTSRSALQQQLSYFADAPMYVWFSVLLLLPLNWSLEALKWKLLTAPLQRLRFLQALGAVLAGVTAGTATPNRIGESAGRIFLLPRNMRVQALGLAAAGSAAQLAVTSLAAAAGLLVAHDALQLPQINLLRVVMLAAAVLAFCFITFLVVRRTELFKKLMQALRSITTQTMAAVLALSAFRYAVYVFQFAVLLRAAGIDLAPPLLAAAVAVTYGLITLIPTFAFTEIVVRGSAAAAVIGGMSGNEPAALSAALVLWAVNVGIPAIIGIWPVLHFRFFKADEYD